MDNSLDNILSDEKPVAEAPAAPPEASKSDAPAAEPVEHATSTRKAHQDKEFAAQGRPRRADGTFLPKDEAAPATPETPAAPTVPAVPAVHEAPAQPEMTEKEKAFFRAAQDERGKRQALEKRVQELEAGKPQEPPKTFWDDPEGMLAKQQQETRALLTNTRLSTAEMIARSRHPDFDEKIAAFKGIVEQNPHIVQTWLGAPDPAEYAYTLGKNHMDLQTAGNLDTLRATIEKETRLKVEAEFKAKAEEEAKRRAAIPGSLSDAPSSGGVNRPTWNGPTPLDDILK